MKRLLTGLVLVLVQLAGAQVSGLEGRWDGLIELPGSPLEVSVSLQRGEGWTGTVDIPAQNATGVPLRAIQVDGQKVRFAIAGIPGEPTFDGTLSDGTLSGTFSQSGQTFPFTLDRQAALTEAERVAVLERGRVLSRQLGERNDVELSGALSDAFKKALGPKEPETFWQEVQDQLGAETRLSEERVSRRAGFEVYTRAASFSKVGPIALEWVLGPDGAVEGLWVRPRPGTPASTKRLTYRTKTALQLPVGGLWYVFWGGRTVAENYHAAYPDQRFALDLLVTRGDSSYRGDGTELSDYYCFGRPLYAPGAGVVIDTVPDLPDQAIGQRDMENIGGNYVIIDHQNGEFSFLGHLRQGSLEVAAGDRVEAGDPVGRCGNSGNSSEPHLHYQLQAGRALFGAEALPAQFLNYTADGKRIVRGEPVQGETVER